MIQSNELRIRNLVYFTGNGNNNPCPILELWKKECLVEYVGNSMGIFYDSDEVHPIELSAEILEKAGFRYGAVPGTVSFDNESNPDETTHYWDYDIKRTEFIDTHSLSLVKWGEQEYFTFQLERGFYRQRIKYLHQLQNLIFALTGEELPVEL